MRLVRSTLTISIPRDVTVNVHGRKVTVKGVRGSLKRDFSHANVNITHFPARFEITVEVWFGDKLQRSCIKTVVTHIKNMITGVTKGYEYKMRFVYAHFPINVVINAEGTVVEIRNFLGEKINRTVNLPHGVKAVRSEKVKDEIVLSGNDVDDVSQSAALIHQRCAVKGKDIRKFLDGIYVSESGVLGETVPV